MKLPSWLHWSPKPQAAETSSSCGEEEDSSKKEVTQSAHEKSEFFSKEDLSASLQYRDEIRFGGKTGRNFIIEDKTPFEFLIKRSSHEKFVLQNCSKDGKEICCNAFGIKSESESLDFQNIGASFIYDEPFRKTDDGNVKYPSFLYGFDPDIPEIWRMIPEKDRGVAISAKNFIKKFVSKERIDGIGPLTFDIRPSEFVGIYGNSGTGKTVLIESLIAPQQKNNWRTRIREKINFLFTKSENSGNLEIDGKDAGSMMQFVSYLPQNIDLPKNLKCRELLNLAMSNRNIFDKAERIGLRTRALAMCALAEKDILDKSYGSLSGGQKRRMTLALTILKKDTRLLIADEPTTGLDVASEQAIMRTLKKISRKGITVITITHSVASCRLFDRVLILRKADSQHTAEISYDGIWNEKVLPEVMKDSEKYTDAQRIAFLSDPNSKFYLPESEEAETEWPFPYGEKFIPPPRVKNIRLLGNEIKEFCLWLYYTIRQIPSWFINSWRMLRRDSKVLVLFTAMAILCVFAMQIGAGTARTQPLVRLFSMLTLAAPWLCATFAAIFVADKLTFYSWEKMSGVHSLSFLLGSWSAQILPVILISAVFTCGMFVSPDTKNISLKTLSYFYEKPQDPSLADGKTTKQRSEPEKRFAPGTISNWLPTLSLLSRSDREKNFDPIISRLYQGDGNTLEQRRKDFSDGVNDAQWLFTPWVDMQEKCLTGIYPKNIKENVTVRPRSNGNEGSNAWSSLWRVLIKPFLQCYLVMLLVDMVGAAIGIAAIAIFRKVNSATIAIVVTFIMFLVFSPMFFSPNCWIYDPISFEEYTQSGMLWNMDDPTDLSQLPAGLISCLCLGRYAFNLICYPAGHPHYAGQLYPMFVILLLSLGIAWLALWNKTKNWKALTR